MALAKTTRSRHHVFALKYFDGPGRISLVSSLPASAVVNLGDKPMIDDTSLEFDMFEDMRRKLVELLVAEKYERLEAEKIALYVIQGVREVPKLMSALAKNSVNARAEVLETLHAVLENAWALEKAKALVLEHESEES
jgi:hypothetical protein